MHAIAHALSITGSMAWEITWALVLGFALSAVISWDYTTWLNIVFLTLAAILVTRFFRTGGQGRALAGPRSWPL